MALTDPGRETDPRLALAEEPEDVEIGSALRPAVAGRARNTGLWAIGGGAAALGLLTFAVLASQRAPTARDAAGVIVPSARPTASMAAAPPATSPDFSAIEAAGRGQGLVAAPPPAPIPAIAPAPTPIPALMGSPPALATLVAPPQPSAAALTLAQRQKAPALVVDLGDGAPAGGAGGASGTPTAGAAGAAGAGGAAGAAAAARDASKAERPPTLNGDEQFAARVESASEPERVRASMLRNQSATIAQGTMIPGVLETALNSDLPGFARAVVSRDVRSFNGTTVLIPRGSHVIGQYRSGVALGASRAFVIWSRVIRPDGGSIQIGSSGTDQLGRAGLEGEVNRHFFQRFGGAVLLSVVNAGITSLTRSPSTSIVIGSSQEATSLASSAFNPTTISPTIKVAQGAPIRIFVARDLDFSPVEGFGR